MLLFDVTTQFDKEIRLYLSHRPEAMSFVLGHERKQVTLSKICNEILVAEKRFKCRMDRKRRDEIVQCAAQYFAITAITHREQQLASEAARLQEQRENGIHPGTGLPMGIHEEVAPLIKEVPRGGTSQGA